MPVQENRNAPFNLSVASAFGLLILFGAISLFADMNYEGGRSVTGQYLKLLGTSALALGIAAGLGEFMGYALRFISGTLADRSRKYWTLIGIGYVVQLSSLPMMAFVSGWQLAIVFLFTERLGKAVRKPAHDAVVSFASSKTGTGLGFGIVEAMDQLGAFIGPALFSLLFFLKSGESLETYRFGLLLLFIPAAVVVILVFIAKLAFPKPEAFELPGARPLIGTKGFPKMFWILTLSAGLMAAGITDFPLIGLHLLGTGLFPEEAIPLLYSGAMAIDAAGALLFGILYDKFGVKALTGLFIVEIFTAPLIFLGGFPGIILGMALWGISTGTQESTLKAAVGDRVEPGKRGRAFGLFHTVFGAFWFAGSVVIGWLYDSWGSMPVVVFSLVMQGGALMFFLTALRENRRSNSDLKGN